MSTAVTDRGQFTALLAASVERVADRGEAVGWEAVTADLRSSGELGESEEVDFAEFAKVAAEVMGSRPERPTERKLGAPLSMRALSQLAEPAEQWVFEGVLPLDANVLVAGYPKSHKTNVLLEIGVSAASGTPFMGHFLTPVRRRAGLVLMEDRAHRIRKRLQRIAQAHDAQLSDLEGWLYLWFRPQLRLTDARAMRELADWAVELELDLLFVDNWSLVSDGDSDKADQVTPQLDALTGIRDRRPMTVGLVHHARKTVKEPTDGERLTDMIRNSSAFGAWYDAGFALVRGADGATVTVRTELRDVPTEPFAFTVEDEHPAGPEVGPYPRGYLRLRASGETPEKVKADAAISRFTPAIIDFLRANNGCSKKDLEEKIPGRGDRMSIRAAFNALCASGVARFDPPKKKGQAGQCWLVGPTSLDLAGTSLTANPDHLADLAAPLRSREHPARVIENPVTSANRQSSEPGDRSGPFADVLDETPAARGAA